MAGPGAGDNEGDDDKNADEEGTQYALVEFRKGVPSRKWTMVLGQTYEVGRAGSGADMEVDNSSLSRRHCSMALTRVDDDIVLVALDKGSTNGTFVNKQRLEKGVGLTKPLKEIRHLVFGECENGYRIVREGDPSGDKRGKTSHIIEISDEPSKESKRDWKDKAAEALQMKAQDEARRRKRVNIEELCGPAEHDTSKRSRASRAGSAWRANDLEAFAAKVKAKALKAAAGGASEPATTANEEIEWPEEWR
mmetsp:Transcript_10559/g.24025  ORF Transcript_10559/g.24025 Transcript_10559/m.24025 type:complete len:250 (+) Transcript_10559:57-806(+)